MRRKMFKHGVAIFIWLAAGQLRVAFAQPPALGQEPQRSSTIMVTASHPARQPVANAEARIRNIVSRQATAFQGFVSFCRKGPITNLDLKVKCGRTHIQSKDQSLGKGLEAFEKHDYTTAMAQFEVAHAKLGYPDAASMLAHMHRHGLGVPKDAAQGIKWLRAVAEDRFNPQRDRMRFNPHKPKATNARIDAAMTLARIYEMGDEVERDWTEAQQWYSSAAEFGFIPAWNTLGETYLSAAGADKNLNLAIDNFDKATKAGYALAAYKLSNLYYLGRDGVVRDMERAHSYFIMAAEAGHPDARLAIGRMYPGITPVAPERAKPAVAGLPDTMASAGADATIDMANEALDLALTKLAANTSDAEALRDLRRAADDLHIAASPPAESQDGVGEAVSVVRVTGLRALPWKSYGALRAAVSAYEKYKLLAPDAVFRFAVMPPAGMRLPLNSALRVRTMRGQEFPIRLEHGELFTLPLLPGLQGDAELVSNLKAGGLRIGLLVHTPTVSPEKLCLGDLRLRYEINAAIAMFDNPWEYDTKCRGKSRWIRCKRPSKEIWHRPWIATHGAWIVDGGGRMPLKVHDDPEKHMYRMPITSEHWSNDVIIELDYSMPMQRPRKLF